MTVAVENIQIHSGAIEGIRERERTREREKTKECTKCVHVMCNTARLCRVIV